MSTCYHIPVSKKITRKFEQILQTWVNECDYQNVMIRKTDNNSKFIVFCRGSIRGIIITLRKGIFNNTIEIKLGAFSSNKDWELLYTLLKFLQGYQKLEIYEERVLLKPEDFTAQYFKEKGAKVHSFDCQLIPKIFEDNQPLSLPIWDLSLDIDQGFLNQIKNNGDFTDIIFNYLQERAYTYMSTKRASMMMVNNKITLSVWNFDDVLFQETDYIVIVNGEDFENAIYVSWLDFINSKLLKFDKVKSSDGFYYLVYKISAQEESEIVNYFQSVSIAMDMIKKF